MRAGQGTSPIEFNESLTIPIFQEVSTLHLEVYEGEATPKRLASRDYKLRASYYGASAKSVRLEMAFENPGDEGDEGEEGEAARESWGSIVVLMEAVNCRVKEDDAEESARGNTSPDSIEKNWWEDYEEVPWWKLLGEGLKAASAAPQPTKDIVNRLPSASTFLSCSPSLLLPLLRNSFSPSTAKNKLP
eukprot:CAMPEP_0114559100 /NCGR_PEP_ID=MMETSP0114-20121206/10743_1 /TAXON_ID=31324 /ORGANISM="Goniomonas sp, Strain m" /LENGTH=188 /DNA_ID=CAMNT_0001744551 /DNA_START=314 /DNA_END=878 /DNA_ORIENTATION=-